MFTQVKEMEEKNFQQTLIEFMERTQPMTFHDNTKSMSKPNFFIDKKTTFQDVSMEPPLFSLELKEKANPYKEANWPTNKIPIEHLFICDDLTLRKLLFYAPDSALAIRDNKRDSIHMFFIVDLFYVSKNRVNSPVKKQEFGLKGKCLLDLRNSTKCENISDIFANIGNYLRNREYIFKERTECYGEYFGEEIGDSGIIREPKYLGL